MSLETLGEWSFTALQCPNETAGKQLLSRIDAFAAAHSNSSSSSSNFAITCINGDTICSRLQLCAALQRLQAKNYVMRSKGKHSTELLLTLSPTRNIGEAFKNFGFTGVEPCVVVGAYNCTTAKLAKQFEAMLLEGGNDHNNIDGVSLLSLDEVVRRSNKELVAQLYSVSAAELASPQGLCGVVVNRIATADVK